ncbi:tyrosine--tRNA ligase [Candidatus Microgenomates bacterium]|nr:tyrosine--tRNA ligase [Candidatus Microgenomates bacterium]
MDKIYELLTRRVDKIYPSKEALEKTLRSGKKLRLYQGFDPSTPNLHIGHLVGLLKLAEFQKQGHEVIFLIGDFTGMIGDPSGKLESRKTLTKKQVLVNAKTYQKQASTVLNFFGKNPAKLKFNSKWNSQLKFADVLKLARHFTVQQLIERDMFKKRLKEGKEIYFNEFMYPLVQGYDSVVMEVDLEIGGSDQMFNMMAGRKLAKEILNKEKFVLTTKLLADAQGNKIGKTEGNVINIAQSPEKFYSQIMSLADAAILPCLELVTNLSLEKIEGIKKALAQGKNPMIYKKMLAFELTKMLNNESAAKKAQAEFEKVFQQRKLPTKIPEIKIREGEWNIIDLLMETKLCSSRSEAKRLLKQGAIEIDKKQLTINNQQLTINNDTIIKAGKRKFVRLIVK